MNRVALWIKRAAEKETWLPSKSTLESAQLTNVEITWATFITDSFSFINNELDAFFEHLVSFPSEGMSMADVFFERLQFLVETILHLTEMSMRDCTVLDNERDDAPKSAESSGKRKRKMSKMAVRGHVNEMERQMAHKKLS